MQPKENTAIPRKDDNISENFELNKDDKLEKQDIEGDHRNLVGKSPNSGNSIRDGLLE